MIRINLLDVRGERRRVALQRLITVAVSIWFSTATMIYLWHVDLVADIESIEGDIAKVKRETDELQKIVGEIEKIRSTKSDLEKKLDVIRGLEAGRAEIVDLLLAVSEVIGDEIWVDKISINRQQISIDANSIDMQSIGLLLQRLKADPRFKDARTKNIAARDAIGNKAGGPVKFNLEVTFVPPQAPKAKEG